MSKFTIKIENLSLGGFCPAYWRNSYPEYGNNNHLADMINADLTNPAHITQGRGISALTNGTDSGNVSTLIKGLLSEIASSDSIYGVGGNTLYPISSSAVSSGHTIDKAAVTSEDGEDVAIYSSNLYYSYNHSGSNGDVGKFDLSSAYTDNWWTGTAGGSALTDNSHQMAVGGTSGVLWIADGQYLKQWDGTTATDDAFNTDDSDSVIESVVWNQDRVHIAANKPNVAGDKNIASIYIWDGTSSNWESRIEVSGIVGALCVKDGVTYVWYQKNLSDDAITLGYVTGTQVKDLANYTGDLPNYYQVTEYKDFLMWVSEDDLFCYGSGDVSLPSRLFQIAATTHSTTGGLTNAFGTPIVCSYDGSSSYEVGEFSGYTTTSSFKTMTFNTAQWARKSTINEMHVNFEQLASGAECDITMRDNQGTAKWTGTISYSGDGAVTRKKFTPQAQCENFRLEFDWSDGSTSNSVSIRNIYIVGDSLT